MHFDATIIGAGISGLAVAHRLARLGRKIAIIESSHTAGGVIHTFYHDGFLLERGPNSFRGTPLLLNLIDELGLKAELLTANPKAPAYVYSDTELHAVPMSVGSALTTRLLSMKGKLKVFAEPFVSRRTASGDESIASFVRRRFGEEVLEKLVAPFVSGIYAGDVEELSMQATIKRLVELEAESGSILRGAVMGIAKNRERRNPGEPSMRAFRLCSFRDGMQALTRALSRELEGQLRTNTQVESIADWREAGQMAGYEVCTVNVGREERLFTRILIVATPSFRAASLVKQIAPGLVSPLNEIRYNSLACVPLAYPRAKIARSLDGFGFLAARRSGLRVLGSIWNTSLFGGRAPENYVLTTSFVGGTRDPQAVTLDDSELVEIVEGNLESVMGRAGAHTLPITRHHSAIPQYSLGHLERVSRIESELSRLPALRLLGNYLDGVSIGHCIEKAETAAVEVEHRLAGRHT